MTVRQLQRLCRDFQVDTFDGFNNNDHSYIEHWLEKNQIKSKKIRRIDAPQSPPKDRIIKEGEIPSTPPLPKARRIKEIPDYPKPIPPEDEKNKD